MSAKFEIEQLEERIAPSTFSLSGLSGGASGHEGTVIWSSSYGNVSSGTHGTGTFSGVTTSPPPFHFT